MTAFKARERSLLRKWKSIKAMARQDVAVARERLADGRAIVTDYVVQRTREGSGYRALHRSRPGMVDQASVNGRSTARGPGSPSAEFDGVAEFVDDLASLAELQARLAAVDFRDAARKSTVPIVLTVVGLARDRGERPGGPSWRGLAAGLRTGNPPGLGDAPDCRSGDGPRGTGGGHWRTTPQP